MKNVEIKRKSKKRYVLVSILILIVAAVSFIPYLAGEWGLALKRNDPFTMYFPLSGRAFDIDNEDVTKINIYKFGPDKETSYISGDNRLDELVEHLNGFRYKVLEHNSADNGEKENLKYFLTITGNSPPLGTTYYFTSNAICIDGFWYYSKETGYFNRLIEMLEENGDSAYEDD